MFQTINFTAVLVANVVAYFAGWLWYSKLLWQKPWMESLGRTQEEWDKKWKKDMPKTILYGFITTLATSFAMAVFLQLVGASSLLEAFQKGLFLCFGFMITSKFSDLIYSYPPPHWGRRAQQLFFIEAGYQILMFGILSTIVWTLSV